MVKAKTGITFLKRLGFVLIALPEPFTTPVGVACVIASGYLTRLRETSLNKHLHETLTRYLSHTKNSSAETDNKSHARQKVKPYTRPDDTTVLWQNTGLVPVDTARPSLIKQNRRDAEDKNAIHHNIDTESLARHYPITIDTKVKSKISNSDASPVNDEKPVPHTVDTQFLSRRYSIANIQKAKTETSKSDAAPVETEKSVHHNVDMQMLGRRYQTTATVNSKTADKPVPTGNVVHHTKHISLSRRFEGNANAGPDSKVKPTVETDETLEHHSINIKALSQRYGHLAPAR